MCDAFSNLFAEPPGYFSAEMQDKALIFSCIYPIMDADVDNELERPFSDSEPTLAVHKLGKWNAPG